MSHNHEKNPKSLTHVEEHARNLEKELSQNKTVGERLSDLFTRFFGTVWFLYVNVIFFVVWIVLNGGFIPGFHVFDPFPFSFLTMFVSLEAIFLSIIVLMSQNRASEMADIREELDLRINIRAEEEITRIVSMLDEIHDHLGLDPEDDEELKEMKKKTDIRKLREDIAREKK